MGNERGNQRIRGSRVALALMGAMFLLAGLLAPAGPARAADVDSLRISQVCAINPDFYAFVEVLDADGNMVKNVQNDQLTCGPGDPGAQDQ